MSGFVPDKTMLFKNHEKDSVTPLGLKCRIRFTNDLMTPRVIGYTYINGRRFNTIGLIPISIREMPSEEDLYIAEQDALRRLDEFCRLRGAV